MSILRFFYIMRRPSSRIWIILKHTQIASAILFHRYLHTANNPWFFQIYHTRHTLTYADTTILLTLHHVLSSIETRDILLLIIYQLKFMNCNQPTYVQVPIDVFFTTYVKKSMYIYIHTHHNLFYCCIYSQLNFSY
jgi:hypothetical protein